MLRKLSLVAVAAASLAAAALAPTSASAWGGWHGRHHGFGWGAPSFYVGGRLSWLRRVLCAATGPDTVGPPLAPGQSLLLSIIAQALRKAPARTGAFHV